MKSAKSICLAAIAACAVSVTSAAAGQVIEPRKVQSPGDLRSGEGALLLSIRHQTPIAQTMHVRFASVDDPARTLKFERKVGLGGRSRMLERQVHVYAVPAGRWRLASHLAGCDEGIEPGQECVLTVGGNSYSLPSATYPADWFVVDVPAGGMTDGGELNLEFPAGTAFGVPATEPSIADRTRSLRFKARTVPPVDKPLAGRFAALKAGGVSRSPQAASATTCERPAKSLKLYYNPFTC